ncbi:ammonia-forming cytochrome c nitrite reductase subunit c552 [Desulfosporosinus sp. PR]|uniref:ammonia-forming cytochrome c nitrite reductase subunit c552 n=1 Tax=Candidatus Desulfosporosinus nitrosoreducens TaxID=3401928 RepID=UPI0027F18AA3|nr:ammonia-forming cytochrome c nitrite reductase subunit c552 [Desulfosporosinus sp. PR]MDQ7095896.1 ammonia-forming cytochrome c nitrite reductase subunit c552 [Desulfosporosinus sp. PR]
MKFKYSKRMLLIIPLVLGIVIITQLPRLYTARQTTAAPNTTSEGAATNSIKIKLPDPEPKTDIYTPIRQEYDKSVHAQSLKVLNDQKQTPGGHVTNSCYQCHSYEYAIAPDSNKPSIQSLTTSITCGTCHTLDAKGYIAFRNAANPTELCSSCHVATGIKPGSAVHNSQSNMFKGTGALGIAAMPDKRYTDGISCADCHMPNENHTFVATLPSQALKDKTIASCYLCHATEDEQKFATHVDQIQTDLKNEAKTFDDRLAKDSKKLAGLTSTPNYNQAKQLTDIVMTNLSFVENDKSWGVHNLDYTKTIMDDIGKKLTQAEQLIN